MENQFLTLKVKQVRPGESVESKSHLIRRTYSNRRMNGATFAAIKFDSN